MCCYTTLSNICHLFITGSQRLRFSQGFIDLLYCKQKQWPELQNFFNFHDCVVGCSVLETGNLKMSRAVEFVQSTES